MPTNRTMKATIVDLSDDTDYRTQVSASLGKDAVEFIEIAAALGWKVMVAKGGNNVTLCPWGDFDVPNRRIHLSASGRNNKSALVKRRRNLIRYGVIGAMKQKEPALFEGISEQSILDNIEEYADRVREVGINHLTGQDGGPQMLFSEPPEEPEKKSKAPQGPRTFTTSGRREPTPAELAQRKAERHIVAERPAVMHAGTGKGYPSKTTIERRWSDGTVDYACALPTCGEVSTNRRAFGGPHWAMHIRRGEAEPVEDRTIVDDPSHVATQKREARPRLEKLKRLLEGIDLKKITAEDLAEQIDQGLRRDDDGTPSEPLTAEQMIERIRRMVDAGFYAEQEEQIAKLHTEVETIMEYADEQIANLEERLSAETARANRADDRWTALVGLIQQEQPNMRFEVG